MSTIKTTYPSASADSALITTYSLSPISNTTNYTLSGSTVLAKTNTGFTYTTISTTHITNILYEFSFATFKTSGYQQNILSSIGNRCEWLIHRGLSSDVMVIGATSGETQLYTIPIANCALSDKFKITYDGAVARFYRNSGYVAGFSASLASYPNGKQPQMNQDSTVIGDGQTNCLFTELTGSTVAGVPSSAIKITAGSGTSIRME